MNKNQEITQRNDFGTLSEKTLKDQLKIARSEVIRYANKFLEAEEKWGFINLLLKQLNSIQDKKQLGETICSGLLKLTEAQIVTCCFFNPDKNQINVKCINYKNKKKLSHIEKINKKIKIFVQKTHDVDKIKELFISISEKNMILTPITYNGTFLGYIILMKDEQEFYKQNINFINIFPEHIALILENISNYDELKERNKIKIQFLAGISHEFKTPLNSIIGFSEILKTKTKTKENYKYLENISQSSKHLLALIEDILDVSKSQMKDLELNYTNFRPKEAIKQILMALEENCREKDVELKYTLADVKICADIKRFRQLIYNLVSNAIKFNKKNGKVNVLTYTKDDFFFFEVSDTGDGISKNDYAKIFDFFSQVNRSQLKRQLGSGIGLALCKKITDAHRGQIDFESRIKKGSRFWFCIPSEKPARK
ncbi:MAG TPA: HAMP domain-containing sensor histidine kinase [Candidatus Gastranaerophilaceae bacterium]|nr:HAMP domain-containing sensor histidine kinase [Candidatus Gastranaerophilaceae bacterium]